jgi:hypothetical protein
LKGISLATFEGRGCCMLNDGMYWLDRLGFTFLNIADFKDVRAG